jgi:hypothetical protein
VVVVHADGREIDVQAVLDSVLDVRGERLAGAQGVGAWGERKQAGTGFGVG